MRTSYAPADPELVYRPRLSTVCSRSNLEHEANATPSPRQKINQDREKLPVRANTKRHLKHSQPRPPCTDGCPVHDHYLKKSGNRRMRNES